MKKILLLLSVVYALVLGQEIGAKYLIITHDNFYEAVEQLGQWKHKKGIRTKIVKLSEIGSGQEQIRNYIVNAYNNWQIQPEYLLLVGAPNYLPFPDIGWATTDNYYTNMDGDIYNEILSGRLTVHNTTEAQNVVNKILLYERTPYMSDSMWFIRATGIVRMDYDNYDDSIYWSDVHQMKNYMLNAGYDLVDTLSSLYGDDKYDVIDKVNLGRSFVLFRGQGVGNWWPPFDVNPDNTANGQKLPIVLSLTCSTIGTGSSPATAERWLLTGSPIQPHGAAGYFATTTVVTSGAYLRSAVSTGFFDAIFAENKRTFGEACEGGRLNVYTLWGDADEYRGFTTLGDPEMNIWTAIPQPIDVTHEISLPIDADSLIVQVELHSVPLESVLVCVMIDSLVYESGYTSSNGEVTLYFDTLYPGTMDITATGKNIIPYEGEINIATNSPYLICTNQIANDSLANNNTAIEAGETILLHTCLKNIGLATAYVASATLRTSDAFIYIIDSLVYYGDIPTQDSALGTSPYVFSVSPMCPGGHIINFNLFIEDSLGNSWTADFSMVVSATGGAIGPDSYGYYIYDDTDTLSGNAPIFSWLEIAPPGPGTIVNEITNEDADTVTYVLPFNFKYYGTNYGSVGICSNGFLEMGSSTYRFGDNGPLPSLGGPKRLLAPFWDDLDPSQYGDIYYYNDLSSHRCIVEFKDCAHYDYPSLRETFQVILLNPQYYLTPTGDGEIVYLYGNVADASSITVGIEDHSELAGLQYLYENIYDQNAAPIVSERALLITTRPPAGSINTPWLYILSFAVSDSSGGNNNNIVEPGETLDVYVNIKNSGDTTAHDVLGTLRCADSYVTSIDSISIFGDIGINSSSGNITDPYEIIIDAVSPDSTVGFVLYLTCNNGTYQKQDYFTVYIYGSTGTLERGQSDILQQYMLQAYPNPCRGAAIIKYQIPNPKFQTNSKFQTELKIFDITGRVVKSIPLPTSDFSLPTSLSWDGTDDFGRRVPDGVYFVCLLTKGSHEPANPQKTEKIVFLK